MNHSISRRSVLLAAAGGATIAITGCSTTSTGTDSTTNELKVVGNLAITNLDPHGPLADGGTSSAGKQIYSRLVVLGDGKYEPDLATEWKPSPDAKTWEFTLRDGVSFSDGTELTSADVVASVKRTAELKGPQAGSWKGITVEAPDKNRVIFTAEKADASMLGKLTLLYITPAAKSIEAGFFSKPIGSGPFIVDSFTPSQTLTLVRNDKYYGAKSKVDKVVMRSIPEISARMVALRNDEIDATWGIPDDQLAQLKDDNTITVESVPSLAVYTMWFNSSRPALADARVRRAIWQAIDYKSIISTLYPTTGRPADAPVAPGVPGYAKQQSVVHDPAAAKTALENAGFDFSKTLELQFSGAEFRQFTQAVAADLAKIGVKVEPKEKEKAVFLEDLLALRWDINLQSLGIDTGDLANNLGRLYTCSAKRTGYCNAELDTLLNDAGSISDAARRADLYGKAQKIIWDEAVGMYPMFVNIAYAWSKDVRGFEPSPVYQPNLTKVTIS